MLMARHGCRDWKPATLLSYVLVVCSSCSGSPHVPTQEEAPAPAVAEVQAEVVETTATPAQVHQGTTVHVIECKPVLQTRKVRDRTRLGWHNELWLVLDGASMSVARSRAHARPEPPIPLDPAAVYTFTVRRIETFSDVTFSLVSIGQGDAVLYPAKGLVIR